MQPKITVTGNITKNINFAMQQNYVPIIRNLVVNNESGVALTNLDLKISFEPDFAKEFVYNIPQIQAGAAVEISPVHISIKSEYLFSLTEKMLGTITINVSQGEEVLYSKDETISLLALDQWSGLLVMPEIVASFVTPNHPCVAGIIADASWILSQWTKDPSFTGYQTRNANNVKLQMGAIYEAIKKQNIIYNNPPASYEEIGQRVRLPHTVIEQKQGTCIDLAILYASCLESVGLHPLLIFNKNHAYAACWLEEETFADCMIDDVSAIEKRVAEGAKSLLIVECTDMVAGKVANFDLSLKHGNDKLKEEFDCAIDIKRSRNSGIRPMPLKYSENEVLEKQTDINGINEAPSMLDNSLAGKVASGNETITKQRIWERKLLDFSLRNALLNFRVNKNAFQIMTADLGELEDKLAEGKDFRVMSAPSEWTFTPKDSKIFEIENEKDLIKNIATEEFKNLRIRTFLNDTELEQKLKGLYRAAKVSMEENGTNTLFMALGFLRWYETDISEKARYAPLVLIPIDIVRNVRDKGYIIRSRQEEAQINVTLLEYLRQDYGVNITGLDPLPEDENGIDLPLVYNTIRQGIMGKKRWNIEEMAFVGLFSFAQFVMWNDIRNRSDELKKNKVVASLIEGAMIWSPITDTITVDEVDEKVDLSKMVVPMAADSSQMVAIAQAAAGQSFVLHGPPGTGKSQTITNMIANALYNGKSVLFVAEKMAALSVVQKRLAKLGLDPFCLELHSNKTNKSSVLSELDKALEVGRIKEPEEYQKTADKLRELKADLNYLIEALHEKRNYGKSLYEAIEIYEKNSNEKDKIAFAKEVFNGVTDNTIAIWDELIREYGILTAQLGEYAKHPLRGIENKEYSMELRNDFEKDTNALLLSYNTVNGAFDTMLSWLKLSKKTEAMINAVLAIFDVATNKAILLSDVVNLDNYENIMADAKKLADTGYAYKNERNAISERFDKAIFNYDVADAKLQWKKASDSWFLPKMLGQNKLLKAMKLYAKNPSEIDKNSIVKIYDSLSSIADKKKEITDTPNQLSSLLGYIFVGVNTNWDELNSAIEKTSQLKDAIDALSIEERITVTNVVKNNAINEKVVSARGILSQYISELKQYMTRYTINADIALDADYLKAINHLLSNYSNNVSKLRDKISFNQIDEKLMNEGLEAVCKAYKEGFVNSDNLAKAYQAALHYTLIINTIAKDSRLSEFNGKHYDDVIAKYKEAIDKYQKLTVQELVARLSANVPVSGTAAASSELGILKKAIKNNGRMLPIRKLFGQIPTLLRRLCPCMLMSPISVAQYIDPTFPKFDLVIFDEASQLPTATAIGTIARGENVVVVGDPKQLPPTSFFTANFVDEENADKEDLESLLDDCLALSMPQEHLKWHYRSRHESLIAYSNMKYYDNKLYTFPSPRDLVSEVKLIQVEGYYDKGKSKQNKAEAKAIVDEIIRRLKDEKLREDSIGVVTFSLVQQHLIDDMLCEEFRKYPELEEFDRASKEPIFIKNLENVQGDERDVILFSIGYGPDENGKVLMNFGPLNREGGWRRLNVAISRARKSMVVYSVLRPEQIDLSRTRSEGVEGLKGFLEFAQRGKNMLAARTDVATKKDDELIEEIAKAIANMGHEVKSNIGCSEYKMDIGVVNPDNKETYILGILIDGENCKEASTANDRFVSQPGVLSGLGWNVLRIWTLDWLDDKKRVLDEIQEAIESAPKAIKMSEGANADCEFKPVAQAPIEETFERVEEAELNTSCSKEYVSYKIIPQGSADEFYLDANFAKVKKLMKNILDVEAPISRRQLVKKVVSAWGINRSTIKVEKVFANALRDLDIRISADGDIAFVWKQDMPALTSYRVADKEGNKRSMDDVPSEEIIIASLEVLKEQGNLSETDLVKETAKKFGYMRLGNVITNTIKNAITKAISEGKMQLLENGYIGKEPI
ncbi:MAG: DUF3320 domain-containing protein [Lachnospira sp.]|nr:DUF3320 domain-containing protein [Lachnospira sp.]